MANEIAEVRKTDPFGFMSRIWDDIFWLYLHIPSQDMRKRFVTALENHPRFLHSFRVRRRISRRGSLATGDGGANEIVPERFQRGADKLSEIISSKDFQEDSRNWEEILEENFKELSDTTLLEILQKHQEICKGHLGEVKATTHRIELELGTRPIRYAPYRAGHKARELTKAEIDRRTAQGVID